MLANIRFCPFRICNIRRVTVICNIHIRLPAQQSICDSTWKCLPNRFIRLCISRKAQTNTFIYHYRFIWASLGSRVFSTSSVALSLPGFVRRRSTTFPYPHPPSMREKFRAKHWSVVWKHGAKYWIESVEMRRTKTYIRARDSLWRVHCSQSTATVRIQYYRTLTNERFTSSWMETIPQIPMR